MPVYLGYFKNCPVIPASLYIFRLLQISKNQRAQVILQGMDLCIRVRQKLGLVIITDNHRHRILHKNRNLHQYIGTLLFPNDPHPHLFYRKACIMDNLSAITASFKLFHNPDGKFPFNRAYQMDYDFYRNGPEFKQIYESTEFKEYFSPQNLNYEKLSSIYLSSGIPNREPVEIKGREAMQEFLTCVDQDFKAQSFEDMASLKRPYATAEISFTFRNPNSNMSEKPQNGAVTYGITDGYKNTIQWLQNHDYGSRFTYSVSEIDYIDIYHYVRQEGSDKMESVKTLKVTDPAQIQLLLDRYETQSIYYNDYYEGVVVYKGGVQPVSPDQFYKEYGYGSAMEAYDTSAPMTHIYFNSGNVPDFILDYFK